MSSSEIVTQTATTFPKEVNCNNCDAVCCRAGVVMSLSPADADFLRSGGTELTDYVDDTSSRIGLGRRVLKILRPNPSKMLYELQNDCGYLDQETGLCTVYGREEKPEGCDGFTAGGYNCRNMRFKAGVDTREEFEVYDRFTRDA